MMAPLNIWIFRLQPGIAAIDNSWVVAQPDRYFIEAHAGAGEQAGESVAHRVRSDPGKSLRLAMLVEWTGEIVSVTVGAVFHFWPEHERVAQSVPGQKGLEA